MSYDCLINRLTKYVERDHGGCDQNTCDIGMALRHGFSAIAIERWSGCGASCKRFDQLFDLLQRKYAPNFKAEYDAEMEAWVFPYVDCPHCNAVLWEPVECDYWCDSCGQRIERLPEVNHE